MRVKTIDIVGWTLGMSAGVYLITDGKTQSHHPWQHALTGPVIGLIPGAVFARKLKRNPEN